MSPKFPSRQKTDEWVRELVRQLPEALWVICGRQKLRWEEVEADWGKALSQHQLGALPDPAARRFLESCDIPTGQIQDAIVKGSQGVPHYLNLAADAVQSIAKRQKPEAKSAGRTKREAGGWKAESRRQNAGCKRQNGKAEGIERSREQGIEPGSRQKNRAIRVSGGGQWAEVGVPGEEKPEWAYPYASLPDVSLLLTRRTRFVMMN